MSGVGVGVSAWNIFNSADYFSKTQNLQICRYSLAIPFAKVQISFIFFVPRVHTFAYRTRHATSKETNHFHFLRIPKFKAKVPLRQNFYFVDQIPAWMLFRTLQSKHLQIKDRSILLILTILYSWLNFHYNQFDSKNLPWLALEPFIG